MSYQVSLQIDGKKLIPAPLVSFTRLVERTPDGSSRRRGWRIVLTGRVVAFKGSPDNDGDFWTLPGYPPDPDQNENAPEKRLANLRDKLAAITDLLDGEGQLLQIQPGDGSATIEARLRVAEVRYDQGQWFDTVPYTIEAEADCVHFGAYDPEDDVCRLGRADNPPEESWGLEPADETARTYRLTHTVSATAKKRFDDTGAVLAEGWEVARAMILGSEDPDHPTLAGSSLPSMLGFNQEFLTAAGVLELSTFLPYNYTRSNQIDQAQGRYSVTETWLCLDPDADQPSGQTAGVALEELTVEQRWAADTGLYTVTVSGTVTGLEERDPATHTLLTTRYQNAAARFAPIVSTPAVVHGIAEAHTGLALNPDVLASTIARNQVAGVINYQVLFDTRPAGTPGYLSESYTATIDHAADVFAEIGVVARPAGPVLQDIGSTTRQAVTVTADIVVPVAYGQALPAMPSWSPLAAALEVLGFVPTQMFLASDRTNVWNPRQGRFSRTATFVYQ